MAHLCHCVCEGARVCAAKRLREATPPRHESYRPLDSRLHLPADRFLHVFPIGKHPEKVPPRLEVLGGHFDGVARRRLAVEKVVQGKHACNGIIGAPVVDPDLVADIVGGNKVSGEVGLEAGSLGVEMAQAPRRLFDLYLCERSGLQGGGRKSEQPAEWRTQQVDTAQAAGTRALQTSRVRVRDVRAAVLPRSG